MFASVNSRAAASAYRRVATETRVQGADPHQLVELLFEGLLQAIAGARGAMARGDTAAKGQAIGKAVRIIEEGLKAGLNLREGGQMAANLHSVYGYAITRLTQANLRNDAAALAEVHGLIEPIAKSWQQIRNTGPAYLQAVPSDSARGA